MTLNTQKRIRLRVLLGEILILLLLFGTVCFAQMTPPQLVSVTVTHVKPDMLQDWQDLVKNELNPALQKAGIPWRAAWATGIFGESFEYVTVTPIAKFAQYDETSPLVKTLGQEGATRFGHKYRKCISGSHTYAVSLRPDLSIMPKAEPKYAVITNVRVIAGKGPEFENWLKTEVLPQYRKLNVPGYLVHQTVFGGDAYEYTILSLINNYADLDKGPWLTQAVGAEEAQKILTHAAPWVSGVERSVMRYVPGLSYMTPPPGK